MRKVIRFRQTTLITLGCGMFLIGLGLARLKISLPLITIFLVLPFVLASWRKKSIIALIAVCLLGLTAGIVRGQTFIPNLRAYDQLNMQKVKLVVVADNDAAYDDHKQLSFDAKHIRVISPYNAELTGKIKIAGFGENAVYKGDTLNIDGKLFKTRGSRQASIGFAQMKLVQRGDSNVDDLRRKFSAGLNNVIPDPEAPFGLGLLIGQRTTLSADATNWLAVVGLTHIIAVSGYNLTIIIRFVHRLMHKRSRYQTVLLSGLLISLFLLLTGLSASIVRASIVCGLSLASWYYGRKIKPTLLIFLTAAITAGWYPVYVWSDVGWYLSFLAFFGVLVLSPLLAKRFCRNKPKALTLALIESFSAQIMTVPIILFVFERFSAVALLSNILVVPLVPLAMLCTLIAGVAGMTAPAWLAVLALPAKWLLTYILEIARLLSSVPKAQISVKASVSVMMVMYVVVAVICLVLWQKVRHSRDIITDRSLI